MPPKAKSDGPLRGFLANLAEFVRLLQRIEAVIIDLSTKQLLGPELQTNLSGQLRAFIANDTPLTRTNLAVTVGRLNASTKADLQQILGPIQNDTTLSNATATRALEQLDALHVPLVSQLCPLAIVCFLVGSEKSIDQVTPISKLPEYRATLESLKLPPGSLSNLKNIEYYMTESEVVWTQTQLKRIHTVIYEHYRVGTSLHVAMQALTAFCHTQCTASENSDSIRRTLDEVAKYETHPALREVNLSHVGALLALVSIGVKEAYCRTTGEQVQIVVFKTALDQIKALSTTVQNMMKFIQFVAENGAGKTAQKTAKQLAVNARSSSVSEKWWIFFLLHYLKHLFPKNSMKDFTEEPRARNAGTDLKRDTILFRVLRTTITRDTRLIKNKGEGVVSETAPTAKPASKAAAKVAAKAVAKAAAKAAPAAKLAAKPAAKPAPRSRSPAKPKIKPEPTTLPSSVTPWHRAKVWQTMIGTISTKDLQKDSNAILVYLIVNYGLSELSMFTDIPVDNSPSRFVRANVLATVALNELNKRRLLKTVNKAKVFQMNLISYETFLIGAAHKKALSVFSHADRLRLTYPDNTRLFMRSCSGWFQSAQAILSKSSDSAQNWFRKLSMCVAYSYIYSEFRDIENNHAVTSVKEGEKTTAPIPPLFNNLSKRFVTFAATSLSTGPDVALPWTQVFAGLFNDTVDHRELLNAQIFRTRTDNNNRKFLATLFQHIFFLCQSTASIVRNSSNFALMQFMVDRVRPHLSGGDNELRDINAVVYGIEQTSIATALSVIPALPIEEPTIRKTYQDTATAAAFSNMAIHPTFFKMALQIGKNPTHTFAVWAKDHTKLTDDLKLPMQTTRTQTFADRQVKMLHELAHLNFFHRYTEAQVAMNDNVSAVYSLVQIACMELTLQILWNIGTNVDVDSTRQLIQTIGKEAWGVTDWSEWINRIAVYLESYYVNTTDLWNTCTRFKELPPHPRTGLFAVDDERKKAVQNVITDVSERANPYTCLLLHSVLDTSSTIFDFIDRNSEFRSSLCVDFLDPFQNYSDEYRRFSSWMTERNSVCVNLKQALNTLRQSLDTKRGDVRKALVREKIISDWSIRDTSQLEREEEEEKKPSRNKRSKKDGGQDKNAPVLAELVSKMVHSGKLDQDDYNAAPNRQNMDAEKTYWRNGLARIKNKLDKKLFELVNNVYEAEEFFSILSDWFELLDPDEDIGKDDPWDTLEEKLQTTTSRVHFSEDKKSLLSNTLENPDLVNILFDNGHKLKKLVIFVDNGKDPWTNAAAYALGVIWEGLFYGYTLRHTLATITTEVVRLERTAIAEDTIKEIKVVTNVPLIVSDKLLDRINICTASDAKRSLVLFVNRLTTAYFEQMASIEKRQDKKKVSGRLHQFLAYSRNVRRIDAVPDEGKASKDTVQSRKQMLVAIGQSIVKQLQTIWGEEVEGDENKANQDSVEADQADSVDEGPDSEAEDDIDANRPIIKQKSSRSRESASDRRLRQLIAAIYTVTMDITNYKHTSKQRRRNAAFGRATIEQWNDFADVHVLRNNVKVGMQDIEKSNDLAREYVTASLFLLMQVMQIINLAAHSTCCNLLLVAKPPAALNPPAPLNGYTITGLRLMLFLQKAQLTLTLSDNGILLFVPFSNDIVTCGKEYLEAIDSTGDFAFDKTVEALTQSLTSKSDAAGGTPVGIDWQQLIRPVTHFDFARSHMMFVFERFWRLCTYIAEKNIDIAAPFFDCWRKDVSKRELFEDMQLQWQSLQLWHSRNSTATGVTIFIVTFMRMLLDSMFAQNTIQNAAEKTLFIDVMMNAQVIPALFVGSSTEVEREKRVITQAQSLQMTFANGKKQGADIDFVQTILLHCLPTHLSALREGFLSQRYQRRTTYPSIQVFGLDLVWRTLQDYEKPPEEDLFFNDKKAYWNSWRRQGITQEITDANAISVLKEVASVFGTVKLMQCKPETDNQLDFVFQRIEEARIYFANNNDPVELVFCVVDYVCLQLQFFEPQNGLEVNPLFAEFLRKKMPDAKSDPAVIEGMSNLHKIINNAIEAHTSNLTARQRKCFDSLQLNPLLGITQRGKIRDNLQSEMDVSLDPATSSEEFDEMMDNYNDTFQKDLKFGADAASIRNMPLYLDNAQGTAKYNDCIQTYFELYVMVVLHFCLKPSSVVANITENMFTKIDVDFCSMYFKRHYLYAQLFALYKSPLTILERVTCATQTQSVRGEIAEIEKKRQITAEEMADLKKKEFLLRLSLADLLCDVGCVHPTGKVVSPLLSTDPQQSLLHSHAIVHAMYVCMMQDMLRHESVIMDAFLDAEKTFVMQKKVHKNVSQREIMDVTHAAYNYVPCYMRYFWNKQHLQELASLNVSTEIMKSELTTTFEQKVSIKAYNRTTCIEKSIDTFLNYALTQIDSKTMPRLRMLSLEALLNQEITVADELKIKYASGLTVPGKARMPVPTIDAIQKPLNVPFYPPAPYQVRWLSGMMSCGMFETIVSKKEIHPITTQLANDFNLCDEFASGDLCERWKTRIRANHVFGEVDYREVYADLHKDSENHNEATVYKNARLTPHFFSLEWPDANVSDLDLFAWDKTLALQELTVLKNDVRVIDQEAEREVMKKQKAKEAERLKKEAELLEAKQNEARAKRRKTKSKEDKVPARRRLKRNNEQDEEQKEEHSEEEKGIAEEKAEQPEVEMDNVITVTVKSVDEDELPEVADEEPIETSEKEDNSQLWIDEIDFEHPRTELARKIALYLRGDTAEIARLFGATTKFNVLQQVLKNSTKKIARTNSKVKLVTKTKTSLLSAKSSADELVELKSLSARQTSTEGLLLLHVESTVDPILDGLQLFLFPHEEQSDAMTASLGEKKFLISPNFKRLDNSDCACDEVIALCLAAANNIATREKLFQVWHAVNRVTFDILHQVCGKQKRYSDVVTLPKIIERGILSLTNANVYDRAQTIARMVGGHVVEEEPFIVLDKLAFNAQNRFACVNSNDSFVNVYEEDLRTLFAERLETYYKMDSRMVGIEDFINWNNRKPTVFPNGIMGESYHGFEIRASNWKLVDDDDSVRAMVFYVGRSHVLFNEQYPVLVITSKYVVYASLMSEVLKENIIQFVISAAADERKEAITHVYPFQPLPLNVLQQTVVNEIAAKMCYERVLWDGIDELYDDDIYTWVLPCAAVTSICLRLSDGLYFNNNNRTTRHNRFIRALRRRFMKHDYETSDEQANRFFYPSIYVSLQPMLKNMSLAFDIKDDEIRDAFDKNKQLVFSTTSVLSLEIPQSQSYSYLFASGRKTLMEFVVASPIVVRNSAAHAILINNVAQKNQQVLFVFPNEPGDLLSATELKNTMEESVRAEPFPVALRVRIPEIKLFQTLHNEEIYALQSLPSTIHVDADVQMRIFSDNNGIIDVEDAITWSETTGMYVIVWNTEHKVVQLAAYFSV